MLTMTNFTGVTSITSVGSTATAEFDKVQAIPAVNLNATSSNVYVNMAPGVVSGLADSVSINLNTVATSASNSVQINGVEKFNVALAGAVGGTEPNGTTFRTTLISGDLESVTVTGSSAGRLAATFSGATLGTETGVFDASATTGGVDPPSSFRPHHQPRRGAGAPFQQVDTRRLWHSSEMQFCHGAHFVFAALILAGERPEVESRSSAAHGGDVGKARGLERCLQHLLGKAAAVGHVEVARGHCRAVTIEDVEWRNGPSGRDVGRLGKFILRNERCHRLQVRAGDHNKALIVQHPMEFSQGDRHLVRIEVLNVVAGEDRIDRAAFYRRHVGHRANDVRFDAGIDVEPQLGPFRRSKAARGPIPTLWPAAYVEEGWHRST